MNSKSVPPGFGLIVIGNEILDGRINDQHFGNTRKLLRKCNIDLRYNLLLSDEPDNIESQLRWAMNRAHPFFCCGGIGSTPDDLTRACAARAARLPLEYHPEGVAIIKNRFGKDATPPRLRMVEFPKGATLIPNPINHVPGFSICNGYFLPGFPEMAMPMMTWVLETYYLPDAERVTHAIVLPGAHEAGLVDLMEEFIRLYPKVAFSSLPRFTPNGTEIELGLAGSPESVKPGLEYLVGRLQELNIAYHLLNEEDNSEFESSQSSGQV